MTLDTSSVRCDVHQTWGLTESGELDVLHAESRSYGCAEHGLGFGSWDQLLIHLEAQHNDEPIPASGEPFHDKTFVFESHQVELEDPE